MSLVPLNPPQSASAAKYMAQSRRPSVHGTRAPRNWFFLHLLVCFVLLFGFKLCLHTYLSSNSPVNHVINDSNDVVDIDKTVSTPRTSTLIKSPLQELSWIESGFERLSEEEIAIYLNIENRAALDVKFFAIPETVYRQSDISLLYSYVEKQLQSARDVLTIQQAEFVLKLIESGVAQGSMIKKEIGDKGSLKNSVVIALMKEDGDNLHFAMAAVSVEPRLGWRLITKKQRNEWNEVLSRVADTRLKQEMIDLFSTVSSMNNNKSDQVKAELERVDDRVLQSLRELFG